MSISLESFRQYAATHAGNQAAFADAGGALSGHSALHGLQKLSSSAKSQENRRIAQAFCDALKDLPGWSLSGEVQGLANEKIASGKPLTAGDIKQGLLMADLAFATFQGRALAQGGQLPAGHGAAFAQFAVSHGLPLGNEAEKGAAVKAYLGATALAPNSPVLARLATLGGPASPRQPEIARILQKNCAPLGGQDGFFARQVGKAIENGGLANFQFADLASCFASANRGSIALLEQMPEGQFQQFAAALTPKQQTGALSAMQAFEASSGQSPIDFGRFAASTLIDQGGTLSTREERAALIRDFHLEQLAREDGMAAALQAHRLPPGLAHALCRNPGVAARAKALMGEAGNPTLPPSKAQAEAALRQALGEFLAGNGAKLQAFVRLAQNPPPGLGEPITEETLPLHINALLAGEDIVEALMADDADTSSAAFLQKLEGFSQALMAANSLSAGEFGTGDANNIQDKALALLLARRGIDLGNPEALGNLLRQAAARFGPVSGDLAIIGNAMRRGPDALRLNLGHIAFMQMRNLQGVAEMLIGQMEKLFRTENPQFAQGSPRDPGFQAAFAKYLDQHAPFSPPISQTGIDSFFETRFQRIGEPSSTAQGIHGFCLAHGVELPAMGQQEQQASLLRQNQAMTAATTSAMVQMLAAFEPEAGRQHNAPPRPEFLALAQAALASDPPIEGIEAGMLFPLSFQEEAHDALAGFVLAAARHGQTPTKAQMREAAIGAIRTKLGTVLATLDGIDHLATQDDPRPSITARMRFRPREKQIMKNLALEYGISSVPMLAALMESARSVATDLRQLATPDATPSLLSSVLASRIAPALLEAQRGVAQIVPPPQNANWKTEIFLRMALAYAGTSQTQAATIYANMVGQPMKTLAGGMAWILNHNDQAQATVMPIMALFDPLRLEAGKLAGDQLSQEARESVAEGENTFFYLDTELPPHAIPGGVSGCLEALQRFAGHEAISDDMVVLAKRRPLLGQQSQEAVLPLMGMAQTTGGCFLSAHWIASVAPELAALAARQGKAPSQAQTWEAVTGERMPFAAGGSRFGQKLEEFVFHRYAQLVAAQGAGADDPQNIRHIISSGSMQLLPPKLMFRLAQPGASLELKDIPIEMNLSSLDSYGPRTAYGLVTDFRRCNRGTSMRFEKAGDGGGHAISPMGIPDHENTPDNEIFQRIIGWAGEISQSETQKARVLQAFSQAGRINPRIYSLAFPGVRYSEHGKFSIAAKQQENGDVIVSIASDPSLPIKCEQAFTIHPDGACECSKFRMWRA